MASFRITTNGLFRNYRTNLQQVHRKINEAMERVETHRELNSYAEDPAAASKSFQLRRSYWRTDDQISNNNHLVSKFQTAFTAVDAVVDGDLEHEDLSGLLASLRGINDATGGGRRALGQDLMAKAQSIVTSMNIRYGDDFVFAGADGLNVPFTFTAESDGEGNRNISLIYRPNDNGGYDVTTADQDTLDALADETTYVDIGLGMREENGELVTSSAYNSSLSGLRFMGYGADEDGDSRNIAVLMQELGMIYSECDPDSGEFISDEDEERARVLVTKLGDAVDRVSEQHVALSAQSHYLETNLNQLNTMRDTLNEQIENIEAVDPAYAITEMSWAQYCYNAALRIGNQILSQSLIDYMQ